MKPRIAACLPPAAALVLLAGCATRGPNPPAPPLLAPQQAGLSTAASATPLPPPRWWQALGSAQLNTLIDTALRDSPSLAAARARVDRARAVAGGVQAATGPQAALAADLTLQRYSEHGLVPPAVAGSTRTSSTVQALFSWSPDPWGQHAADTAAALGQAQAARADAALAATALAAQLVRGHVALAQGLAQLELAQRVWAQRQDLLALVRQRVQAGLDHTQELALAEAAVPDAQAQLEALAEQVTLAQRALAVLSGQPPGALQGYRPRLDALQLPAALADRATTAAVPDADAYTPSLDLLGRRADIVAARWRVEAAQQDLVSAQAQFYPNISLAAFAGVSVLGLHHLLDLGSRQAGITPALRLPLFDGGRLRAQQGVRQADLAAAVAQYNGVLLQAVREAGDAWASAQALLRQQQQQAAALQHAEAAHRIAQQRHAAGLVNRLLVLHTESQWLAQRRQALDLRARQLQTHAALMQALGGGWADHAAEGGAALPQLQQQQQP